jgi:RNA:NAD 2'-phosphotransferase (TPT1/KptA family)
MLLEDTIPETIYHATLDDVLPLIYSIGLVPNDVGVINLSNDPDCSAGFLAARNYTRIGNVSWIVVDGVEMPSVDSTHHNSAVVLAVSTQHLDLSLLTVNEADSGDASTNALPPRLVSYTYSGTIKPEYISTVDIYKRGDKRIPDCFS